jgi:LssY-like putative type I secretion system component LssY
VAAGGYADRDCGKLAVPEMRQSLKAHSLIAISMNRARLYKTLIVAILLCVAAAAVLMMHSFQFHPDPTGDGDFMARAQQKSAPGIKISASALGARESQRSFGENLADYDIQPVWLSIENDTDDQLVYLPIAMDPDYYSPYEVSYRFHGALSFAANRARDKFFLERQISSIVPPHSHTAGFMYGVLDAGVKYTHILIAGHDRLETFDFALRVPGPAFVGTNIRADSIYPGQKIEDLDLEGLRTTLAKYPCCTTNSNATRDGDPLNIVVVESKTDPIVPFIARDWHLTRKLDVASMIETARAFVFRNEFLTSPVSPLYVFGRREDVALQKARSTINERIHARLWLTPYTFGTRRVWIGQVSRDIGVRLTAQTWNLTTHKISPDVDFDRGYLLQDLLMSGSVERYGFVDGVGAANASAPRMNLTGDPYYTDGLRVVLFLSNQTTPLSEIERLPWELPPALSQEAR